MERQIEIRGTGKCRSRTAEINDGADGYIFEEPVIVVREPPKIKDRSARVISETPTTTIYGTEMIYQNVNHFIYLHETEGNIWNHRDQRWSPQIRYHLWNRQKSKWACINKLVRETMVLH